MNFIWRDYDSKAMGDIEAWLDDVAIKSTGLDDGFCGFFEYWQMKKDMFLDRIFGVKLFTKIMPHLGSLVFASTNAKWSLWNLLSNPKSVVKVMAQKFSNN